MGLDGVELLIAVEEKFGISISDEEAQGLFIVGQLYELIVSKLPTSHACGSMIVFNRLRRGFRAVGFSRGEISPETLLAPLLPLGRRRELWKRLSAVSQLKLPDLRRPLWVKLMLVVVACLATLPVLFLGPGLSASIATALLSTVVLVIASRPAALQLPDGCTSVADLAQMLVSSFPFLSAPRPGREEVWSLLVDTVVRIVGVSASEVTPHARFVDDLGLDA